MNALTRNRQKATPNGTGLKKKFSVCAVFAASIWCFAPSFAMAATTSDARVKTIDLDDIGSAPAFKVRFAKASGGNIDAEGSCSPFWSYFPSSLSAENTDRLVSMLLTAQAQQSYLHVTIVDAGSGRCEIERLQIQH